MKLPIPIDMEPMLSAPGDGIPKGDTWEYEPKWDGLRTLVFRDGDKGPAPARAVWQTAQAVLVKDYGNLTVGDLLKRFHP